MLIGKVLLVVEDVPFGMDTSSAGDNTSLARDSHGNVTKKYSSMNGEVVDTLGSLFEESFLEDLPSQVLGDSVNLSKMELGQ